MSPPLRDVRVLELSRILAGPWAGQTLADLGASVVKVERPGVGDDTRQWGPPFVARAGGDAVEGTAAEGNAAEGDRDAAYYLCANRGKRSIEVDITRPEGQRIVRDLAARSDVLIENFKVGGLARYGLDYASLSAVNPGLVYCSITGFGQTGPYRALPGYDFLIQGMGGLMSVTGEPDSEPDGAPGGKPVKVGVAVTDVFTGLYAVIAERLGTRTRADWLTVFEAAGVPCGPINDIGELFDDPQVQARGLRVEIPDTPPDRACRADGSAPVPTLPGVASPMRFSATPLRYDRPPPRLGEHTDDVLRSELGMIDADIERLRADGVIG